MTAPSARLLGLLLAALSLPCATAACGSNGDPKAPPPAREGAVSGPEGTATNCDGVVCPQGTFCDTQTASKHRCHSAPPYVGRPFDAVAALAGRLDWT